MNRIILQNILAKIGEPQTVFGITGMVLSAEIINDTLVIAMERTDQISRKVEMGC